MQRKSDTGQCTLEPLAADLHERGLFIRHRCAIDRTGSRDICHHLKACSGRENAVSDVSLLQTSQFTVRHLVLLDLLRGGCHPSPALEFCSPAFLNMYGISQRALLTVVWLTTTTECVSCLIAAAASQVCTWTRSLELSSGTSSRRLQPMGPRCRSALNLKP